LLYRAEVDRNAVEHGTFFDCEHRATTRQRARVVDALHVANGRQLHVRTTNFHFANEHGTATRQRARVVDALSVTDD
jgi:hypothetical protein